jgi:predicted RNA-binding protein Jag
MGTELVQGKAREILLKAQEDAAFMFVGHSHLQLQKGRYGGWLLRGSSEVEEAYGLWCFAVKMSDEVSADVSEVVKPYVEKLKELAAKLGVSADPKISLLTLSFRAARFVKKKTTENYTVYDMEVLDDSADALAVAVHYPVWYSRRGRCHGAVCHVLDKMQMLVRAEFKDAAYGSTGVLIPYETEALEALISKVSEEAKKEAEEDEGEEAAEPVRGDAYLVAVVFKDEAVAKEVADKVRELLRGLKIRAEVKVIHAEL